MVDNVWDVERVSRIGSIVDRYAARVEVGAAVRLGLEGDPYYPYRSVDDAPTGEVVSTRRDEHGLLTMDVRMSGAGNVITLDNRSLRPDGVWEIVYKDGDDPRHRAANTPPDGVQLLMDERPAEEADRRHEGDADLDDSPRGVRIEAGGYDDTRHDHRDDDVGRDAEERGGAHRDDNRHAFDVTNEVAAHDDDDRHAFDMEREEGGLSRGAPLEEVYGRIDRMEAMDADFRTTTASTLRYLAADILRLSRGEALEFANDYATKYDMAVDTFRGSKKERDRYDRHSHFSGSEDSADVAPLLYANSDLLTP